MYDAKHQPPRVLFYSPAAEFKGGAERSLMDLVTSPGIVPLAVSPAEGAVAVALRRKGVPVHILSFGSIGEIRRPFKLRDGIRALFALYTRASSLKKICREERIDFIHSNGLKAHVVAIVAKQLGAPPAVVHIRDIPLTGQERLVWRLLEVGATKLVLVSRACWPWPNLPTKASVIFNGIELREAPPARPESTLVLGFFGRIHQAKGLHLLVDWMKAINDAGIPARLVIRGVFYDEARNYEAELNDQIRRLEIEKVVEFQGFRNDPASVYEGIDVVCVPSHVPDPLPRAVMEAMALGLPVIAYPAGGILEMIDNGKDGFLAADAAQCVAAIRALQDPDRRAKIRQAAIRRAETQFALRNLHHSIDQMYCDLQVKSTPVGGAGDAKPTLKETSLP